LTRGGDATKRGSEIWVFTRRVRRERGQFPSITGRATLFDRASNGGAYRLDLVFSIRRRRGGGGVFLARVRRRRRVQSREFGVRGSGCGDITVVQRLQEFHDRVCGSHVRDEGVGVAQKCWPPVIDDEIQIDALFRRERVRVRVPFRSKRASGGG